MSLDGGCACGAIRFRLTNTPMIVHACHCRDCQKQSGSAFVINLWIERKFLAPSGAEPVAFSVPPGSSGNPHDVFRRPDCGTALRSNHHAPPGATPLFPAGPLDDAAPPT